MTRDFESEKRNKQNSIDLQQELQGSNELMYWYQIYTRQECAQKLLEKEIVKQSNKNQNNANSERIKRQT